MGREIRRVPPSWEHPKDSNGNYIPMHNKNFDEAFVAWCEGYRLWRTGNHPNQKDYPFWEWEGYPPHPEHYHHFKEEEATWYQMYENVTEGTPVTPPFKTKEELIEYLSEHGTFWDQKEGKGGWKCENAEKFVESGYAPSFMVVSSEKGCRIKTPRDGI